MRSQRPTSLKATNHRSVVDEFEEARSAYEKAGRGLRKALDQAVMKGIEKAEEMENDDKKWDDFKESDRWRTRKEKPESLVEVLFFSLVYILDDRKQASKIHTAVRPLYGDISLTAAQIVKHIRENGGYEKLAVAARKKSTVARLASIQIAVPGTDLGGIVFPCDLKIRLVGRQGNRLVGEIRPS